MSSASTDSTAMLAAANRAAIAGHSAEAIGLYRALLARNDAPLAAHVNLAATLLAVREFDAAAQAAQAAIAAFPASADAHSVFGEVALAAGFPVRAEAAFERALTLAPPTPGRLNNLAQALQGQGRIAQALAVLERACALAPTDTVLASNALMCAQYDPPDMRAVQWPGPRGVARPSVRDADPGRRLRVGYVSPDFCSHSCSYFLVPPLAAHDRAAVEVFAYGDVAVPDGVTAAFRGLVGNWRDTAGLDDAAFAARVKTDEIDVLVDCAGHTKGNRLAAFAHRPAPVQVTWLGYPDTTGLDAFDARIVDALSDPPGPADGRASEPLARIAGGFLAYMPPPFAPPVAPLPMAARGTPTFGSFNNLPKVTARTLDLWAGALRAVPGARMVVKARGLDEPELRTRLLDGFASRGVPADRIEPVGFTGAIQDHIARYAAIDVALDTTPYNGTTTTCEALWMGVPVVTLEGDRHAARVGASLLGHLGAGAWVARDPASFATIAAGLVADTAQLAAIRSGLRARMAGSALCDGVRLARGLEALYRRLWQRVVSPPAMV
jgi:protein O-GlcNAc transferase